jgi:hypothetical protein
VWLDLRRIVRLNTEQSWLSQGKVTEQGEGVARFEEDCAAEHRAGMASSRKSD